MRIKVYTSGKGMWEPLNKINRAYMHKLKKFSAYLPIALKLDERYNRIKRTAKPVADLIQFLRQTKLCFRLFLMYFQYLHIAKSGKLNWSIKSQHDG